jgi:hypothetical protein
MPPLAVVISPFERVAAAPEMTERRPFLGLARGITGSSLEGGE